MKQSGNALFLILIAVALFAALSYAVTQSGRGGGNIDRETVALSSSSFVSQSNLVHNTVQRLLLFGCHETELSFEKSPFDGSDAAYVNAGAAGGFACHVYHPNGGGIPEVTPSSFQGLTNGSPDFEVYASTNNISAGPLFGGPGSLPDLSIIVRNLTEEACLSINESVGIPPPIPVDSGDLNVEPFDGDYTPVDNLDGTINISPSPWGSRGIGNACFEEQSSGDYIYFHLLIYRGL